MALNKNDNWFVSKTGPNELIIHRSGHVATVGVNTLGGGAGSLVTSNITVTTGTVYRISSLSSDITLTLPSAASNIDSEVGFKIQMDNMGGKTVTIANASGDTIDGQDGYVMNVPRLFIRLKSDGVSDWMLI